MIAAFSPELPSASRRSVSATKAENELKATVADADVEAAMAGTAGVVTEDAIVEQAEPASAVALEAPMAVGARFGALATTIALCSSESCCQFSSSSSDLRAFGTGQHAG